MSRCYFELRGASTQGNFDLAADMMRHLHTRQYLGKTIVICQRPAILMPAAHKQWLRLSRTIQRQRASTINADKILKYTRTITHMQHLRLVARTPLESPDADVFFLTQDQLDSLPLQCFNVYCTTKLPAHILSSITAQLPAQALIVDYTSTNRWRDHNAIPKRELELEVSSQWQSAKNFLAKHDIDPVLLLDNSIQSVQAMDDALDTLLGVSIDFLPVAHSFNRALELARPLRLSKTARQQYDAFTILAHRVQALATSSFSQQFLETYNEDDTFFLYDVRKIFQTSNLESLADAIARHRAAGRHHLARALQP